MCHQAAAWGTQLYAQRQFRSETPPEPTYSPSLRKFNVIMLAVHGFFHALHLLQTHTTYDGLHGDVSFQSSQVSVIVLLGVIYAMEAPKRGMFFGVPSHKGLSEAGLYVLKKYHGEAGHLSPTDPATFTAIPCPETPWFDRSFATQATPSTTRRFGRSGATRWSPCGAS